MKPIVTLLLLFSLSACAATRAVKDIGVRNLSKPMNAYESKSEYFLEGRENRGTYHARTSKPLIDSLTQSNETKIEILNENIAMISHIEYGEAINNSELIEVDPNSLPIVGSHKVSKSSKILRPILYPPAVLFDVVTFPFQLPSIGKRVSGK